MQIKEELKYYQELCSIFKENFEFGKIIKRKDEKISGLEKKFSSTNGKNAFLEEWNSGCKIQSRRMRTRRTRQNCVSIIQHTSVYLHIASLCK